MEELLGAIFKLLWMRGIITQDECERICGTLIIGNDVRDTARVIEAILSKGGKG